VREAAVVIDMEMRENDSFHVEWSYGECTQLRADLLILFDPKRHFPSPVRMQGFGAFEQMCSLARIHDDHAFRVLDDPCVRRKPLRPAAISKYREPASQPAPSALDLRGLDTDRAGLDGVDGHTFLAIDPTTSGRSK
jgi:hypothetical protein